MSRTVSVYNVSRCVRIPKHLYDCLEKEAELTGIGIPAVMVRFIIVSRLRSGNLELLADVISAIPYNADQGLRTNIFLSDELVELTNAATDQVAKGKFSKLVIGILSERYK